MRMGDAPKKRTCEGLQLGISYLERNPSPSTATGGADHQRTHICVGTRGRRRSTWGRVEGRVWACGAAQACAQGLGKRHAAMRGRVEARAWVRGRRCVGLRLAAQAQDTGACGRGGGRCGGVRRLLQRRPPGRCEVTGAQGWGWGQGHEASCEQAGVGGGGLGSARSNHLG